jgi:hypothetical protein
MGKLNLKGIVSQSKESPDEEMKNETVPPMMKPP